jgi:hypothetical protein
VVLDQTVIAGVDKYFANAATLPLAGTAYTPSAFKAVLQREIDTVRALDVARAAIAQLVATARAARTDAGAARRALKAYVLGAYGPAAVQMLQDLGIPVPKPKGGKRSAATKAIAVVKAEATRKARGTIGRKKKQAIKGVPTDAELMAAVGITQL